MTPPSFIWAAGIGRALTERAVTIWSLTGPELYALRVATAGQSPADYERWLAGLLIAVLLDPSGTDAGRSESSELSLSQPNPAT